MPKPRKHERFAGKYFTWSVYVRDGVFWADGRSNSVNAGRHSLGTKDRTEAITRIERLDLTIAIEHGLAEPELLTPSTGDELSLEAGRKLYEDHAARPRITGGTRSSTQKRYRAVFDKFIPFLKSKHVDCWNRVTDKLLEQYLRHLENEGYAYATQYLEATTIKQVLNFFVEKKRLPAEVKVSLSLSKPQGTDTYCWRPEEVVAIIDWTLQNPNMNWLHAIVVTLTYTGLRIGELVSLRWGDIDVSQRMIRLTDESTSARRNRNREARTTKGGRDRSFPIHEELYPVLASLPHYSDGYVFHGPNHGRLKPDTVRNILIREVLKPLAQRFPTRAGEIGFAHGRLHSFRHFFCSLCANSGVPQQMVMRFLGHRDSKLVSHYYHLHDQEAQRQLQKVRLKPETGTNKDDKIE